MPRLTALILIATFILTISGCSTKYKATAPTLLQPLKDATTEQLITEVNRIAGVKSLRGKVDIQFEDSSFAQLGLVEKYRTAAGTVIVQRPEKINLKIQVPFFGTNVAEMTSDGEHFRVAVLQGDTKYRKFIKGTNNAAYSTLKVDENKDEQKKSEQKTVSVLSNVRPQHFTDALLLKSIEPKRETGFFYAQSEFFQDEIDNRPNAKKNGRVLRGYYLLEELKAKDDNTLKVMRRFWFDRVNEIRLARIQTYDEKDEIVSDVAYGAQAVFGENGTMKMPVRIEVLRLKEKYKLTFVYQEPAEVFVNEDYPVEAFLLENKWKLPEVDLDNKPAP